MFSGCFGEDVENRSISMNSLLMLLNLFFEDSISIEVSSDVDWTMNRSPGFYFMDDYSVLRDGEMTFAASLTSQHSLFLIQSDPILL